MATEKILTMNKKEILRLQVIEKGCNGMVPNLLNGSEIRQNNNTVIQ
jgi:hypothetical protein